MRSLYDSLAVRVSGLLARNVIVVRTSDQGSGKHLLVYLSRAISGDIASRNPHQTVGFWATVDRITCCLQWEKEPIEVS